MYNLTPKRPLEPSILPNVEPPVRRLAPPDYEGTPPVPEISPIPETISPLGIPDFDNTPPPPTVLPEPEKEPLPNSDEPEENKK